jgi:hypothetical protein
VHDLLLVVVVVQMDKVTNQLKSNNTRLKGLVTKVRCFQPPAADAAAAAAAMRHSCCVPALADWPLPLPTSITCCCGAVHMNQLARAFSPLTSTKSAAMLHCT